MVWLCSGQSVSQTAARLEEPQQTLEEAQFPLRQNFDAGRQQDRLDTSYLPAMEAGQSVDNDEAQLDQTKDDMKTDEFRFWRHRPYYGRRWGWGWNAYPVWGWNGYRGWGNYGYGRSYPYYGYYW
jgi:hypothetical protein